MKPKSVNIMGQTYSIDYCAKPSDVDIHGQESLMGQLDWWSRSIRLLDQPSKDALWQALFHEILHGLDLDGKLKLKHETLDLLATLLYDTLNRNGWLRLDVKP